jgi:hypothetical protein
MMFRYVRVGVFVLRGSVIVTAYCAEYWRGVLASAVKENYHKTPVSHPFSSHFLF